MNIGNMKRTVLRSRLLYRHFNHILDRSRPRWLLYSTSNMGSPNEVRLISKISKREVSNVHGQHESSKLQRESAKEVAMRLKNDIERAMQEYVQKQRNRSFVKVVTQSLITIPTTRGHSVDLCLSELLKVPMNYEVTKPYFMSSYANLKNRRISKKKRGIEGNSSTAPLRHDIISKGTSNTAAHAQKILPKMTVQPSSPLLRNNISNRGRKSNAPDLTTSCKNIGNPINPSCTKTKPLKSVQSAEQILDPKSTTSSQVSNPPKIKYGTTSKESFMENNSLPISTCDANRISEKPSTSALAPSPLTISCGLDILEIDSKSTSEAIPKDAINYTKAAPTKKLSTKTKDVAYPHLHYQYGTKSGARDPIKTKALFSDSVSRQSNRLTSTRNTKNFSQPPSSYGKVPATNPCKKSTSPPLNQSYKSSASSLTNPCAPDVKDYLLSSASPILQQKLETKYSKFEAIDPVKSTTSVCLSEPPKPECSSTSTQGLSEINNLAPTTSGAKVESRQPNHTDKAAPFNTFSKVVSPIENNKLKSTSISICQGMYSKGSNSDTAVVPNKIACIGFTGKPGSRLWCPNIEISFKPADSKCNCVVTLTESQPAPTGLEQVEPINLKADLTPAPPTTRQNYPKLEISSEPSKCDATLTHMFYGATKSLAINTSVSRSSPASSREKFPATNSSARAASTKNSCEKDESPCGRDNENLKGEYSNETVCQTLFSKGSSTVTNPARSLSTKFTGEPDKHTNMLCKNIETKSVNIKAPETESTLLCDSECHCGTTESPPPSVCANTNSIPPSSLKQATTPPSLGPFENAPRTKSSAKSVLSSPNNSINGAVPPCDFDVEDYVLSSKPKSEPSFPVVCQTNENKSTKSEASHPIKSTTLLGGRAPSKHKCCCATSALCYCSKANLYVKTSSPPPSPREKEIPATSCAIVAPPSEIPASVPECQAILLKNSSNVLALTPANTIISSEPMSYKKVGTTDVQSVSIDSKKSTSLKCGSEPSKGKCEVTSTEGLCGKIISPPSETSALLSEGLCGNAASPPASSCQKSTTANTCGKPKLPPANPCGKSVSPPATLCGKAAAPSTNTCEKSTSSSKNLCKKSEPSNPCGKDASPPPSPCGKSKSPPANPCEKPTTPPANPCEKAASTPENPCGKDSYSSPPPSLCGKAVSSPAKPCGKSASPPPCGKAASPPPCGKAASPPPCGKTASPPPCGKDASPPPCGKSASPSPCGKAASPPPSPCGKSTSPPANPCGKAASPSPSPCGKAASPPPSPCGKAASPPANPCGKTTSPPANPCDKAASPPANPCGKDASTPPSPCGKPTSPPANTCEKVASPSTNPCDSSSASAPTKDQVCSTTCGSTYKKEDEKIVAEIEGDKEKIRDKLCPSSEKNSCKPK